MAGTSDNTGSSINVIGQESSSPRYSEFKRMVSIFFGRPLPTIGLAILAILVFMAIFAPLLAPYDPYKLDYPNKLQPPSSQHLLGTDSVGRDTLTRIMYGARTSLVVAILAIVIAFAVGLILGTIAGYFGGIAYTVIMRFIDTLMAFPMILLALVIAAMLGGGMKNVIIALGVGMISAPCRMMCGVAMGIKQQEYITAQRAIGSGNLRTMLFHVLPNAFPTLLIVMTVGLGATILAEATLSFLGIGIVPPTPAWGSMVSEGYKYLLTSPILAISPGIAIMLVVFSFNMVGDGLRDALDPRLRGVL
jgi:peptide/nickel transport system permease protein